MSLYAIGDVQGCYDDLQRLLDGINFDSATDHLWFTGDLINRGPRNVETLRFIRGLKNTATTVLGNHDLHYLAVVFGGHRRLQKDTFGDVMAARDADELAHWLRHLPLIVTDDRFILTHAGIPHIWDEKETVDAARSVEDVIRGPDYGQFFADMYGNEPRRWTSDVVAMDRLRIITNYFTRMRFVAPDGTLDFEFKEGLGTAPNPYKAWFEYPSQIKKTIVFGHWAALNGEVDHSHVVATDTGCVWGRGLTAVRLDDMTRFTWIAERLKRSQ